MGRLLVGALGLLFVLTSFSLPVHAKANGHPHEILTYQELMLLSPAKRVAYIRDLRQVLVILERMEIKADELLGQRKTADVSDLHERIAELTSFLAVMPEALADAADALPTAGSMVFPVYKNGAWGCSGNGAYGNFVFAPDVGTCVLAGSANNFIPAQVNSDPSSFPSRSCGINQTAVYVTDSSGEAPSGKSYCASNSALSVMNHDRAAKLKNPDGETPSTASLFNNTSRLPSGYQNATGDIAVGGAGIASRRGLMSGNQADAVRAAGGDPSTLPAPSAPSAAAAPPASGSGSIWDKVPIPGATPAAGSPPVAAATPAAGGTPCDWPATPHYNANNTSTPCTVPPAATTPEVAGPAGAPKCQKVSSDDKAKARTELAKKKKNGKIPCVNGGNFTDYAGEQAVENGCVARQTADYTNIQYFGTDGKQIKSGGKDATSCSDSKTQRGLCAPEMFCDSSDAAHVKVYCYPKSGDSDDIKNKNYTNICKQTIEKSTSKCDPSKLQGGPSHEAISAIKKNIEDTYKEYCQNTDSFKKLFCSECADVGAQLAKMEPPATAAAPAGTTTPAAVH